MISNPSLLSYTCIAKGTVILAEFVSRQEPGIEAIALRCIENTPPHHSMFSHTVHKKTYTFAIDDDSFVSFAISDETMENLNHSGSVARESRNPSIDSSKGRRAALMPLLGKPLKALKKKKRLHNEGKGEDSCEVGSIQEISEKNVDLCGNGNNGVLRKELRNGLLSDHHHRQKAKQIWKKHVWVVLMFDFCICAILFGIWLWICEGFQCIEG
ncbi:unnamed protein product [Arabidopsis arenosa]|uniref:Uncharacterized protein n=1 Tax=Arabidopsis arenosa TaxID=38785 RepID=A0A8S2B025_ARAAE|nr:unnamed protein product [Arabidopsis arenosa]